MPDLIWSTRLEEEAKMYGDNCVFEHSQTTDGENLAWAYSDPVEAINAWVNERNLYDYTSTQVQRNLTHFTQMVWASTKEVGCAMSFCKRTRVPYYVCRYRPTGNHLLGNSNDEAAIFRENVFAPV